jgi:hypothetical protein
MVISNSYSGVCAAFAKNAKRSASDGATLLIPEPLFQHSLKCHDPMNGGNAA